MPFTTRFTLLNSLANLGPVEWESFFELYRPLIQLRGHDHGLTSTEKEELTQDVMLSFFKGAQSFVYDPSVGRFRTYLRTIIDRKSVDLLRKRKGKVISMEVLEHFEPADPESQEDKWDEAFKKQILDSALEELKESSNPNTWDAFYALTFEKKKAQEVSETLGMSVNSVYFAKHRIMTKLKRMIEVMERI